jgi:hypothetical protein
MESTLVRHTYTEDLESQARRSCLSLHFNTKRRRCWLLLQLVSMPVSTEQVQEQEDGYDNAGTWKAPTAPVRESLAHSYSRLLDNYEATQHLMRNR